MKTKFEKEIKGLRRSFYFALRGIKSCVQTERNMRIHITVTVFVMIFSTFYEFTRGEICLLLLVIGSVMGMEIINTSIETVIDMCAPAYSSAAKIAKDLAAGAVLIASITAVIIGIVLFWDITAFREIFDYFIETPLMLAGILALLAASLLFIFKKDK